MRRHRLVRAADPTRTRVCAGPPLGTGVLNQCTLLPHKSPRLVELIADCVRVSAHQVTRRPHADLANEVAKVRAENAAL